MIDINNEEAIDFMINAEMSHPKSLNELDPEKDFVYDRHYGLFFVPFGRHTIAMATLYSFHKGFVFYGDLSDGYVDTSKIADKFIDEIEGTAFKSSVADSVYYRNLSSMEKRLFSKYWGLTKI
jgi:hypothetical protein